MRYYPMTFGLALIELSNHMYYCDIGRSEDSPATHLVVYEQDGSLTVYKLDCMKK